MDPTPTPKATCHFCGKNTLKILKNGRLPRHSTSNPAFAWSVRRAQEHRATGQPETREQAEAAGLCTWLPVDEVLAAGSWDCDGSGQFRRGA